MSSPEMRRLMRNSRPKRNTITISCPKEECKWQRTVTRSYLSVVKVEYENHRMQHEEKAKRKTVAEASAEVNQKFIDKYVDNEIDDMKEEKAREEAMDQYYAEEAIMNG